MNKNLLKISCLFSLFGVCALNSASSPLEDLVKQTLGGPVLLENLPCVQVGNQIAGDVDQTNTNSCWLQVFLHGALANAIAQGDDNLVETIERYCQFDPDSIMLSAFFHAITLDAFLDKVCEAVQPQHNNSFLPVVLSNQELRDQANALRGVFRSCGFAGDDFITFVRNIVARVASLPNPENLSFEQQLKGLFSGLVIYPDFSDSIISQDYIDFFISILSAQRPENSPFIVAPLSSHLERGLMVEHYFADSYSLDRELISIKLNQLKENRISHFTAMVLLDHHWVSLVFYKDSTGKIEFIWMDSLYAWQGNPDQNPERIKGSSVGEKAIITRAVLEILRPINVRPIPGDPELEQRFRGLIDELLARTLAFGEDQDKVLSADADFLAKRQDAIEQENVDEEAQRLELAKFEAIKRQSEEDARIAQQIANEDLAMIDQENADAEFARTLSEQSEEAAPANQSTASPIQVGTTPELNASAIENKTWTAWAWSLISPRAWLGY